MTRHLWVEKSRQVPSHLRCARVLNKRSAAQRANSNTVVSGRVLNKAKERNIYIYFFFSSKKASQDFFEVLNEPAHAKRA